MRGTAGRFYWLEKFKKKKKSSWKLGCVTETIFSTGSNCWTFDQLTTLLCQHSHTTETNDNERECSCIPAFTYYTRWDELFRLQWRASRSRIQINARPTIIKADVPHQPLGDNALKGVRKPEYRHTHTQKAALHFNIYIVCSWCSLAAAVVYGLGKCSLSAAEQFDHKAVCLSYCVRDHVLSWRCVPVCTLNPQVY